MAMSRLLFVLLILTLIAERCLVESDCPEDWIDCGNGNCIADIWRCDGDNDCGNFKDEQDCDNLPSKKCLSSQFQCLEDGHCIPDTWSCDGEHDCEDGSDEHTCENDTHCHGFKCKDNHCIPSMWKCDGRKDCPDGSDEEFCSKDLCAATEFTCSSGTCLDRKRVCDSKKDCPDASDEGKLCSQLCNATKPTCSQNCRRTPKGPECYCNEGFTVGKDGKTCEDVNECSVEGFCSQLCTNRIGSFECSCVDGYHLLNNTCLASGPEPVLVFSNLHEIRAMFLRTRRYFPVHSALAKAASVDVDPLESRVYWVEISNKSSVYSSKLDGSSFSTVLTNGLMVPEGIAVDYVARNLYFTDSGLKQILACKIDGSMCHVLHSTNIGRPRAIAVDPPEGLLYWSDWGESTSGIYRSGMDGSRRIAMVSKDIQWPNGIAIDHTSNRLYWSDAKLLTIEYVTLDGKIRKVIIKNEVYHPYSLAVFEDNLYWSDWTTFTLESSNKFTGHKTTVMVRENGKHIMGVHVYHPVLARRANNPCWGSSCSHICLIAPLNNYRCACPPGFSLGRNGRTCSVDSNYPMLLVNDESKIYHIRPEAAGSTAISELPLSHVELIGRLAYDWKTRTLFVSDMKTPAIYSFNMTSFSRRELVRHHLVSPEGMAFDPISGNLYWADSNKGTVEVVTTTGLKRLVIVANLSKPMDIALVLEVGRMFVPTIGRSPSVWMFDMDGKNGKVLNAAVGLPIALAVHPSAGLLYWADPRMGTISSIDYTNSNSEPKIVREKIGNVMSIAINDKFLYWTDSKYHVLHLATHNESHSHTISLPGVRSGLVSRKVIYATSPKSRRSFGMDCANNNGGCSFLCLTSPGGRTCACPFGVQLSQDGKSCSDKQCPSTEFQCPRSEKCIPRDYVCDGIKDCPDGSDETCEGTIPKCPNNDFACANGRCILSSWKCDGRDDCGDNSDEKGCPPPQNCTTKQLACLNGECIPTLWRCDGENDCKDGSDEMDCHATTCDAETQLRCDHGQCIPISWACDGAPDCMDSTDERNCTTKTCGSGKFACKNGMCIDQVMVCDSRMDCEDGSDEMNCSQANTTCKAGRFACEDGMTCIYAHEVCDGYKDCLRGEDEVNCTNASVECTSEEYFCTNTSKCISRRWICDGDDDCGDGSDEPSDCIDIIEPALPSVCDAYSCPVTGECISWSQVCNNEHDCADLMDEGPLCVQSCTRNNGGCAHRCQRTPQGSKCSCFDGYVLSNDGLACEDADECSIPGRCSHFCNNTKGGFKCSCAEGYILEYDHRRCKAASGTAYLTFMLPDEIRGMNLNWPYTIQSRRLAEAADMRGMDWDSKVETFYWTDWEKKTINWLKNDTHYGVLVHTLVRPHYLRRDWITENIYYTDDEGSIVCCTGEGKYCATVIRKAAPHINSFDIAPLESLMFWTVWELSPESSGLLERAEMDGSNRKIIVSSNIMWPSAVTVDHILKMVYWTDAKRHVLECADFNGLKRRVVVFKGLSHPFSMTMFEDYLYLSDWATSNLMRCEKYNGKNCTKVYHGSVKAEVLLVEHNATQPRGTNRCASSGCPHICLPAKSSFVCRCDDHFLPVQTRCELNMAALSTESTKRPCPNDYCLAGAECVVARGRYFCKCPPSYMGDRCDVAVAYTQSPYDSSWIVGVVLAVLFVGLIVAIAFFCRKNREKLTKMGETVAVSFRNTGLHRRSSKLIEDEEDGSCDELDIGKKPSKQSNFGNPLFGKKTRKLEESEDGFKRWESHDSENSAFMSDSQAESGSGFRILEGPRRTTDRFLHFFKK
ncbi:low-density lipoprotein receptor-related protein 2-like [Argiope bruennichi]|nr:low-density lipoprotein receptor-related protein 2-like [Argiope bruennichi]